MIRKSDIGLRIGITMLVFCATLLLTVLPAAAYYNADNPLVTYDQGTINGSMDYTIGNSSYSSKLWNYNSTTGTNDSYFVALNPETSDTALNYSARLYVYWTWAFNDTNSSSTYDTGVEPNMTVTINGNVINTTKPDTRYVDWKDNSNAGNDDILYNYPSGTYAYDVTSYIDATSDETYVVNVTNTKPYAGDDGSTLGTDKESFNIQAIGLLTLYNESLGGTDKKYWIDEGSDWLNNAYNYTTDTWNYSTPTDSAVTPDDCVAFANFSGVDTTGMNSATLITCVPAGGTKYNRLYVNGFFNYWDGLWNADPYKDFSWTTTDISSNLIDDKTNYVGFQNGLYSMIPTSVSSQESQMQAANAFLLIR